jgi:hypothetical protein
VRQHIPEKQLRHQVGLNLAVRAGEQAVRFFQGNRRAALGALMFDEQVDIGYSLTGLRAEIFGLQKK